MIGGRVLDASAVLAFATGTSVYCSGVVWSAVQESIVRALRSSAVATASADLPQPHQPVLEVALTLHLTVIASLDGERAPTAVRLGGT